MAKIVRNRVAVKPTQQGNNIILIFKGVVISLIVSLICIIFVSVISLASENTYIERYIQYIVVGINMISIFIGSVYAAQRVESRGMITGIAIGVIYVLISVAVGVKISNETISLLILANKFTAGIAAGALGGVIGVNL